MASTALEPEPLEEIRRCRFNHKPSCEDQPSTPQRKSMGTNRVHLSEVGGPGLTSASSGRRDGAADAGVGRHEPWLKILRTMLIPILRSIGRSRRCVAFEAVRN